MTVQDYILEEIKHSGSVTPQQIASNTGRTRQFVHKVVTQMIEAGLIVRTGQTRSVKYVSPGSDLVKAIASRPFEVNRRYSTKDLDENDVFFYVQNKTNILDLLPENVFRIFRYGLTEMLNNAIDHSGAKTVQVIARRNREQLSFTITDAGVGIFENIRKKFSLESEEQAMQDLLKGKLTTLPIRHSGQGIFFTSRVADRFIIESSTYRLLLDNNIDDIFFQTKSRRRGTRIIFEISTSSLRNLKDVFDSYSSADEGFTKTDYRVKLYRIDSEFVSRSQAKKLMHNLDKFEIVELDFDRVSFVGQGFVDEIFRVWQRQYPNIQTNYVNASPEVEFMIRRVLAEMKNN